MIRSSTVSFGAPFTAEYIQQHLDPFGPVDRVVFDSASGLAATSEHPAVFRRTILDLIRFFDDEFDATAIFAAEAGGGIENNPLEFTTHGVVSLERRLVDSDLHRFLTVTKMRGVDHDHRTFELELDGGGVRVGPGRRSQPAALKDHRHRPVDLEGLDALCGAGLVRGAGVVLQHDGRANLTALFGTILDHGVEGDDALVLVPTIDLHESRAERLPAGHDHDLEFAADRLFVVDLLGAWDPGREKVFAAPGDAAGFEAVVDEIVSRVAGTTTTLVNADAVVHTYGAAGAREIRYHQETAALGPDDLLLHVLNPNVVADEESAFSHDAADQVVDT